MDQSILFCSFPSRDMKVGIVVCWLAERPLLSSVGFPQSAHTVLLDRELTSVEFALPANAAL